MSGWDLQSLASIVFGLFFIALGVMNLIDPPELRADDAQLRYGDGGTDLLPVRALRWPWIMFILLGLFHILLPRKGPGDEPVLLIGMGAFLLAAVLWGPLVDPRLQARRMKRYEASLAGLAAESGTYTDELRALHASPPFAPPRRWLQTAIITLFGGAFLALGLAIPR